MRLLVGIVVLSSPLLLTTVALFYDVRERPEVRLRQRVIIISLIPNELFFLVLGFVALRYISDFRLVDRTSHIMIFLTAIQMAVCGFVVGLRWRTRTLAVSGAVILCLLWYQTGFIT